jgi:hypothetical protein
MTAKRVDNNKPRRMTVDFPGPLTSTDGQRRAAADELLRFHNPKVAGSNPAPATIESAGHTGRPVKVGPLRDC